MNFGCGALLHALGNGAVPQQVALAMQVLAARLVEEATAS